MPAPSSSLRSPQRADLASSTVDAARTSFDEHFELTEEASPVVVYQQAPLAIQADHTHYSEGFALFAGLPHGVAVVARPSSDGLSRLATSNMPARVALPPDEPLRTDATMTTRVVHGVLAATSGPPPALDIAVAHALPSACRDAYAAALVRAVHRAIVQCAPATSSPFDASFVPVAQSVLADTQGRPYSDAYPLSVSDAAHSNGHLAPFVLVDTPEHDALPVPAQHNDALQWGFFAPGVPSQYTPATSQHRKQRVQAALAALQSTEDFAELRTFSSLEHRALDRAIRQVAPEHRPIVRHLVTENRRVQKHVVALRHGDGQMSGALLHMTHASLQTTWNGASAAANFLVGQAKGYTEAGLYGAGMTGRDGYVLTVGRRPAYPAHIRTLCERYEATFHHPVPFIAL